MRKGYNPQGNLRRAERKVRQFSDTKEWCGYLTPSEIFALLDDGAKAQDAPLEYIRDNLANGDSSPHWFYFVPTKAQLDRFRNRW